MINNRIDYYTKGQKTNSAQGYKNMATKDIISAFPLLTLPLFFKI